MKRVHWHLVLPCLILQLSCGSKHSSVGEDSLVQSMAAESQRVSSDYRGEALCTAEPTLNVRAEPSITADKVSPALDTGEKVVVSDVKLDAVSHQHYAHIGHGWVDVRWLKKVVPPPPTDDASCSPQYEHAYAAAAITNPARALLSVIGYGEGTGNCYNLMFGYKKFLSYAEHPDECRPFANTCSTAAGRYQFLTRTWNAIQRVENYQDFGPLNQDAGAIYLLKRRGVENYDEALSYTELVENSKLMSWEWASLPPGRYGQGFKSYEQIWSRYSLYVSE